MPAAGVSELLNTDDRPVFVVSDDRQARERLAAALTDANGSRPVTAAEPERFADAAETVVPAGLVAVRTDGGEPVPWDAVGSDAPDRSASDARSALAAAVADDRYPAVAVGPDLDVAAAYEAGVDVAVPLALAAHRETIADRVTAAVDRRRGSELRSDLLNETNDGIVVHDPETGEIVDTNDRFYDMLGYDPETDDVTLDDITGHDDEFTRSRAVSLIRDAAAGSPSTFEWRDPTNDGSSLWVEVKLEAATLAGEEYVVSSVRDINDRKDRERELEASRERLQRLQEITSDPDSDFESQVESLLAFGADQLGLDLAFVGRVDAPDDTFRVEYAHGDHPILAAGAESDLADSYCRWTLDSDAESPLAADRAADDDAVRDAAVERWGLGCYLGAEISVDGLPFGTLCFASEDPRERPFSDTEQAFVEYMAQWLQQEFERREHLETVERTRRRLENTFERVQDGFFAVDEEWRVRYANEAGLEILQQAMSETYDADEILGKHLWEEVPDAVDTGFYQEYHRAMREQEPVTFEERYEPLDVWFEVRAYPDEDGLSVYFSDVTERKERERELYVLERAVEEASLPLTMADPHEDDTPLVFVNKAFEELTGYDAAEALGRNCRFMQGPETDPETVAEIRAAIENEETISTVVRNYTADGVPFWNRLELTPIYDEDGTLLRYLGSQYDVTEQRRSREVRRRLLETTRELIDASTCEAVAAVVSDAATEILDHDVNAVYLPDGEASPERLAPTAASASGRAAFADLPAVLGDGVLDRVAERDEPLIVDDLRDRDGADALAPLRSLLLLPIGGAGVLAVGSRDVASFDDSEVDRARLLTTSAGRALSRTDRRAELERYETLFETVRDKLYVTDADGRIEMVSESLADAVGADRTELIGEHVSALVTAETAADERGAVFDLLVTPDATSGTFEGALSGPDGEPVPVEIELSPLPYEDDYRGTVGAVRDISERRRREEELDVFQAAIDEAGVGLAMYDADGRFEYVNDHYARLLGTTRERVASTPVWEFVEDLDADAFDAYWDSFADGETRSRETTHQRPDRTTVPVESVTTAVRIDGVRHHLVTVRGIRSRRERRQQSEVLHRIIRHNLRNDLSIILGHAEMLETALDGDEAGSAETIFETADDLRGLADAAKDAADLIDRETVRKPVDVVELLRRELDALDPDCDPTVRTDMPDEQYVLADDPLGTAFRQLLANAVEHADGDPTVSVAVRETDRAGWCAIEIADDGPGIPDHELEVLTAGEETSLEHGSGIGLWVVYWAVTRYGGELRFEEPSGGGSRVVVELPAADARGR